MINNKKTLFELLRYIFLTFVIVLGFITLVATGGGGGNGGGTTDGASTTNGGGDDGVVAGTPTKTVLYDPKSLFISNINNSEVIAASQSNSFQLSQITQDDITGENKLYQITQDDRIFEVPFLDENDSDLEVMTIYIGYLNASYIYIEFEVLENAEMPGGLPPPSGSPNCALINLESGIIYDLSDFSGMGGPEHGCNILGITNNLLFLISNSTLYNIDLSTMVATPMNNPEYDPIAGWINSFIYYNESLNKSYVAINEIDPAQPSNGIKVYCTDNSLPVETLIEGVSHDMYWVAGNYKIYSDNNLYFVNGAIINGPPVDEREAGRSLVI